MFRHWAIFRFSIILRIKHCIYKVVQIWPGLVRLVYTQISPGHIWTTLYITFVCCVDGESSTSLLLGRPIDCVDDNTRSFPRSASYFIPIWPYLANIDQTKVTVRPSLPKFMWIEWLEERNGQFFKIPDDTQPVVTFQQHVFSYSDMFSPTRLFHYLIALIIREQLNLLFSNIQFAKFYSHARGQLFCVLATLSSAVNTQCKW
jgi:hypothetical protein